MDAIAKANGLPLLTNVEEKQTSPVDSAYNCIAWAFGDKTRFWWPSNSPNAYWPLPADGLTVLQAFEAWFASDGWEETADHAFDPTYVKVALYAANGAPTHAARLIREGVWTSKLGRWIDLSHGLDELDGPAYGSVLKIYRKPT